MGEATWQFKVHVLLGLTLIAMIPFTRLVHAFSAPLHYLFLSLHRLPEPRRRAEAVAHGEGSRLGSHRHPGQQEMTAR